jgi:hypothetical protein
MGCWRLLLTKHLPWPLKLDGGGGHQKEAALWPTCVAPGRKHEAKVVYSQTLLCTVVYSCVQPDLCQEEEAAAAAAAANN